MTAGPGEVDGQGVAALLARPVDRPERDGQSAQGAPLPRHEPDLGVGGEVRHQLVEGVGDVERRQPDLVGLRAEARHAPDRDVQQ